MRIKRFNEQHSEIDPYNEENWNDDNIDVNQNDDINGLLGEENWDDDVDIRGQMQGVCPACGGGDLAYEGPDVYGNGQIAYEVDCMDCNYTGYEIYNTEFDRFARR